MKPVCRQQEAAASLAKEEAKEISMDTPVAVVLPETRGHFHVKRRAKNRI